MCLLKFIIFLVFSVFVELIRTESCISSNTTASGSLFVSQSQICSGQLIFQDNFDTLDQSTWQHEVTLAGGGNNEFEWYVNSRDNSFTKDGNLHIVPRLTSDYFGEDFLTSGRVTIPPNECTNSDNWGCDRQGTPEHIINPVRSARIRTLNSFSFKYGTLEVRAKMPAGDWLWPAIWLLPTSQVYGVWPRSGEIDLIESRGNRKLFSGNTNVGTEQMGSTLHFGPRWDFNGWSTAHYVKNSVPSFSDTFHTYKLIWTPDYLQFFVDEQQIGKVDVGIGFWDRGHFDGSGLPNPWAGRPPVAPFDQEFHILINAAVGGTNGYFSDWLRNEGAVKPWKNSSPTAMRDFWNGKGDWLTTWNYQKNDDSTLIVDYVRVWAL